ncbi:signal peptidase I [Candidatus Peregrinibacteria bacterium]|nr:MAG: signal peptidase I [Candidatus Peregrinibacteria bacterium]
MSLAKTPTPTKPSFPQDPPVSRWREFGLFVADVLYNVVVIVVLVVLIRTFLVSPFKVVGSSMADTLENNEYILIDRLSYRISEPKRGDPIVFLPPITNKDGAKFDELVTTNEAGLATLDTHLLRSRKRVIYCKLKPLQNLWFCQEGIKKDDLAYFQPVDSETYTAGSSIRWDQHQKKLVTADEADAEQITFTGAPSTSYAVRIYDPLGPEYFVKRIIGVPGDTIRIENGRVYVRPQNASDFYELSETYLNSENELNTYYKRLPDQRDVVVPEGHFFVMGDNRGHSNDSRHWFSPIDESYSPFLDQSSIGGKVLVVLWPFNHVRLVDSGLLDSLNDQ